MKQAIPLLILSWGIPISTALGQTGRKARTFCNPINIDYRFSLDKPSRREAADPVIVLYKGDYYLFASKSGGYWYSGDMRDWTFVEPQGLPIENYAPAVMVSGDTLYYMAGMTAIYSTDHPKRGAWREVSKPGDVGDPDLFRDDDGRVYLYHGCSHDGPIEGMELDPANELRVLGKPFVCLYGDYAHRGWERIGDDNLGAMRSGKHEDAPWIEGPWMTKHVGTYYLQYAAPGTEFKTYADGVFTSKSPRGPFTYAPYNPFSFKPRGFITGAGHSCTFQDKQGRYWHVVTMGITDKHAFERRLGLFPAGFDKDGQLHANTYLGDYPQFFPGEAKDPENANLANWMPLSYRKTGQASSTLGRYSAQNAVDEDVKTYWSAQTADPGEWLMIDLAKRCKIQAIQTNFAEHASTALGRKQPLFHQYVIEISNDGRQWSILIDKSKNRRDVPHDYVELAAPSMARFVRLTNVRFPGGGPFSVRELRVFGSALGPKPGRVSHFEVTRDENDERNARVAWRGAKDATGYVVRYGIAPAKLYNNYQVLDGTSVDIHSLDAGQDYYFTVDAFNDSGITRGTVATATRSRRIPAKPASLTTVH